MNYFLTGEVAKRLNISVRTIRYYDEIGLVVPTKKEENGKRFYTPEDILMLEKVLLLKSTSMPLNDIEKIINMISTETVLSVHKEQLVQNIKQLNESLDYTNTLINTIKLEGNIQWENLIPLLSEDPALKEARKNDTMEELFSEEEQKTLNEQLPKMESDSSQIAKWINLIKRIELCLKEGKSPSSEEGKLIAEDTLILSNEMFNGDVELERKFWEARKSKDNSSDLNLYPVQEEVITFMEKAIVCQQKDQINS
ncbi:MerR family transcriptional regulator [Gracilibacillus caseinilyticus]|uniref:MerR family transcriptional regulator n=1 Tax=Gracilibacillus caseinilyticus TaxID=2932256 RepID=A0ABY4F0K6_9BACI|nr:MerR family transcriptional regulator [Gracilibacillus caseinilyticus]UOQ50055.1 MerR family transcriptional regulator [Gracilibacillus caseinilyticus]